MKTLTAKFWTSEQLIKFSDALGSGYVPGINQAKTADGDRWTAQRHIQASMLRGQAYL